MTSQVWYNWLIIIIVIIHGILVFWIESRLTMLEKQRVTSVLYLCDLDNRIRKLENK